MSKCDIITNTRETRRSWEQVAWIQDLKIANMVTHPNRPPLWKVLKSTRIRRKINGNGVLTCMGTNRKQIEMKIGNEQNNGENNGIH